MTHSPEPGRVDPTLAYYETHAEAYVARTEGLDVSAPRAAFLNALPPSPFILDAGCGSGRDAAAFLAAGCRVLAIDASPALARLASERLGMPVHVLRHEDVRFGPMFDGIWAMATLLHVRPDDLPDVLARYVGALRPGGRLVCTFKSGEESGPDDDGRWVTRYPARTLGALARKVPGVDHVTVATGADSRRADMAWLTATIIKTTNAVDGFGDILHALTAP